MSETAKEAMRAWQVPPKNVKGGNWYEIPMWMAIAGAVPVPKHHYTLRDGTVVAPGEWIAEHGDGTIFKSLSLPPGYEAVPLRVM